MLTRRKLGETAQGRSVAARSPTVATTPPRPRILIVSSVRLYREGVLLSLAQTQEIEILGAADPSEAFLRISDLRPDVVLLDCSLDDSLSLPRRLREIAPTVKMVAFAISGVDQDVIACAEAGIAAFVARDGSTEDLVSAVHQSMRGELSCSPRLTALLVGRVAALAAGRALPGAGGTLTQREREIVPLVEQGLSNKEIARKLCIGTATTKNHVHNILEKLQVRRRGEVAARLRRDPLRDPVVVPRALPANEGAG